MSTETTPRSPWPALRLFGGGATILLAVGTLAVCCPAYLFDRPLVTLDQPAAVSSGEPAPLVVAVRRRATGRPAAGVPVTVTGGNGGVRLAGCTDAAGVCSLALPTTALPDAPALPYQVQVGPAGGGASLSGSLPFRRPPPPLPTTLLLTDKPCYQPGQTIQFAAWLFGATAPTVPAPDEAVTVRLCDPQGRIAWQRDGRSSARGNVPGAIPLGEDILPGVYRLEVSRGTSKETRPLTVARYVPRRLAIALQFGSGYLTLDQPAPVQLTVSYFAGAPAAQVPVRLLVRPPGGGTPTDLPLTTDAAGRARAEFRAPAAWLPATATWADLTWAVAVTDGGTPETHDGTVRLYRHDRLVQLLPDGGVVVPGQPNRFLLCAYRPDGTPAPGEYRLRWGATALAVVVGQTGLAEAVLPLPVAPAALTVSWRDAAGQPQTETFAPERFPLSQMRVSLPFHRPLPGERLVGTVTLAPALRGRVRQLGVRLVSQGRIVASESLPPPPPTADATAFALLLPSVADRHLRLEVSARVADGQQAVSVVRVPLVPAPHRLDVRPAQATVAPGSDTELRLRLTDAQGQPVTGAVTVAVADAAVLARHGGALPADEWAAWAARLAPELKLPPPVIAALGQDLPGSFLPVLAAGRTLRLSNEYSVRAEDDARLRLWRHAVLALVGGLLAAVLVVGVTVMLLRLGALLKVLAVVAVLTILAGMCLPVLSKSREKARRLGGPPIGEAEALAARQAAAGTLTDADAVPLAVPARDDLRETLLFAPAVELDAAGKAKLPLHVPDNLTAWHVAALGVPPAGRPAAAGAEFRAAKALGIVPDFPVAFVRGDEPVLRLQIVSAVAGEVRVELVPAPFYTAERHTATVTVAPGGTRALAFPVCFTTAGKHVLTVRATCGAASDELRQPILVTEHGRPLGAVASGRLAAGGTVTHDLTLAAPVSRADHCLLVQGAPVATLQSGFEALLREPTGCFEQTTAVNYPNIMVVKYLRQTKRLRPDLEQPALTRLERGYQRLLGFEVASGGFSLYGGAPASVWLSAVGLWQLEELGGLVAVDPAVVERTARYVEAALPSADARTRAYALWALARAQRQSTVVTQGLDRTAAELPQLAADPYAALLAANALLAAGRASAETHAAAAAAARQVLAGKYAAARTLSGAWEGGAAAELLALAALALGRTNGDPLLLAAVVDALVARRLPGGAWPGTQATVLALQALTETSAPTPATGTVELLCGDQVCLRLDLTAADLTPLTREFVRPGIAPLTLRFAGTGCLSYSLVARGQQAWGAVAGDLQPPLSATLAAPAGAVAVGREIPVRLRLANRGAAADNCLIEIGLSPGVTVLPATLTPALGPGRLNKYEIAPERLVLYWSGLAPGAAVEVAFSLLAQHPGVWQLPPVRIYEYYNPANQGGSPGPRLHLTE